MPGITYLVWASFENDRRIRQIYNRGQKPSGRLRNVTNYLCFATEA